MFKGDGIMQYINKRKLTKATGALKQMADASTT